MDHVRVDLGQCTGGEAREAGDAPTDGRALGGDGDEAGVADRDDDDVRAGSARPVAHLGDEVVSLGGGGDLCTEGEGGGEAVGAPARHDGCVGAGRERAVDESDGAGAQDEDPRALGDGQAGGGPQAAGEGFGEG